MRRSAPDHKRRKGILLDCYQGASRLTRRGFLRLAVEASDEPQYTGMDIGIGIGNRYKNMFRYKNRTGIRTQMGRGS